MRQRVYQIAACYEDANDADRLRADPTFQVVAGSGTDVLDRNRRSRVSQYAVDWVSIRRLMTCGVDWFCQHAFPRRAHPRELVLDVDGTDARAHGAQQLALFNGYYRERVYHLLVWSEGTTGLPLRTRLRPGDVHGTTGLLADLCKIPAGPPAPLSAHPRVVPRRCGDGDAGGGARARSRGRRLCAGHRAASRLSTAHGSVPPARGSPLCPHAPADRPPHAFLVSRAPLAAPPTHPRDTRRSTAHGTSLRFMITNRSGRAAELITWYQGRGAAENGIKELKREVHADRLCCHRYRPNALRLQLHTVAQLLLAYFRRTVLRRTDLATAAVETIRTQLFTRWRRGSPTVSAASGFTWPRTGRAPRCSAPVTRAYRPPLADAPSHTVVVLHALTLDVWAALPLHTPAQPGFHRFPRLSRAQSSPVWAGRHRPHAHSCRYRQFMGTSDPASPITSSPARRRTRASGTCRPRG